MVGLTVDGISRKIKPDHGYHIEGGSLDGVTFIHYLPVLYRLAVDWRGGYPAVPADECGESLALELTAGNSGSVIAKSGTHWSTFGGCFLLRELYFS